MEQQLELLEQLVIKAKDGDKEAFAELYSMIYKELFRFTYFYLRNQCDAEDVISETVIVAYNTIAKLRQSNKFKEWIFKIAYNKCKRHMREYYIKNDTLSDEITSTDRDIDLDELVDLKNAIEFLNDEERLIISLNIAGYDSGEIADITKINRNTVRSKQARALEKLGNNMLTTKVKDEIDTTI